jgi:hypothetical protein
MRILCTDQRSEGWRQARVGRLTGSRAGDMLARIKSGEAAARRNLRVQLVLERLTNTPQESGYVSADMQYGIDREPDAVAAYEAETGLVVEPCGFFAHDTLLAGGSPDGVIGDLDGILELKCCKSATHLEFLKSREIPAAHLAQIRHNIWITGAAWCDYVSFDDRFPPDLHLEIVRVTRRDVDLIAYELAASLFLSECEQELASIRRLRCAAVAV